LLLDIGNAVERQRAADAHGKLDEEHRAEFLRTRSNEEAARVLDRMAPDDAADLLNMLDQERRLPVLNLMAASQQLKLRKLLQYHPTTAGGMMSPDYVWVVRGATVEEAIEAIRTDDKTPHQLLSTVFVTEHDGKFVGSVAAVDLIRANRGRKVDELDKLVKMHVDASADLTEFSLLVSDYNLTAIAVTDHGDNLIGAISVDDLIGQLIPDDWRSRAEASAGD